MCAKPEERPVRRWGLRLGTILMGIDLLLFTLLLVIVRAGILPFEVSASLNRLWAAVHWPMHDIVIPFVLPHVPSHSAGARSALAIGSYGIASSVQAFIIGFALGQAGRYFAVRRRKRNAGKLT